MLFIGWTWPCMFWVSLSGDWWYLALKHTLNYFDLLESLPQYFGLIRPYGRTWCLLARLLSPIQCISASTSGSALRSIVFGIAMWFWHFGHFCSYRHFIGLTFIQWVTILSTTVSPLKRVPKNMSAWFFQHGTSFCHGIYIGVAHTLAWHSISCPALLCRV